VGSGAPAARHRNCCCAQLVRHKCSGGALKMLVSCGACCWGRVAEPAGQVQHMCTPLCDMGFGVDGVEQANSRRWHQGGLFCCTVMWWAVQSTCSGHDRHQCSKSLDPTQWGATAAGAVVLPCKR
jgi:hypothetical protein